MQACVPLVVLEVGVAAAAQKLLDDFLVIILARDDEARIARLIDHIDMQVLAGIIEERYHLIFPIVPRLAQEQMSVDPGDIWRHIPMLPGTPGSHGTGGDTMPGRTPPAATSGRGPRCRKP